MRNCTPDARETAELADSSRVWSARHGHAAAAVLFWLTKSGRPTWTISSNHQSQPGQVQIKADEKELQGIYSNLVMIHHHAEEFTLNFVYVFPNATQGKLMSSVIVSPAHAKRIWRALGENIARYRSAIWRDQRRTRGQHADTGQYRLRTVESPAEERPLRFRAASDQAILVYLGDEIGLECACASDEIDASACRRSRRSGCGTCSRRIVRCRVSFDACRVDHAEVETTLREYEERAEDAAASFSSANRDTGVLRRRVWPGPGGCRRDARANAGRCRGASKFTNLSSLFFGICAGLRLSGRSTGRDRHGATRIATKKSGCRERGHCRKSDSGVSVRNAGRMETDRADAVANVSHGSRADGTNFRGR